MSDKVLGAFLCRYTLGDTEASRLWGLAPEMPFWGLLMGAVGDAIRLGVEAVAPTEAR
jgi:hypothetical protein